MTTESSGFPALRNGLDVLRAFDAGHDRLGVVELAERTGLHKSTVSRLLVALEDEGLARRRAGQARRSPPRAARWDRPA